MTDNFSRYMNPPTELELTRDEIEAVLKFREILKKGHSAEIKQKTDGGLTVYEVRKEKK